MRYLLVSSVLVVCASLALLAASPPPADAARDICVKILEPVKSMVGMRPGATMTGGQTKPSEVAIVEVAIGDCAVGPLPKVFRFQLVYPPRGLGGSQPSVTTQAAPIPYTIRAAAQVADGTQGNNQGAVTFRLLPGGTASCLTLGR